MDWGAKWVITAGRVWMIVSVLALGCSKSRGPAEPEGYPFVVSEVEVENRVIRAVVQTNPAVSEPVAGPVQLLVVFSPQADFDVRKVKTKPMTAVGMSDPEFGGQVLFYTLAGKGNQGYGGAWWLGAAESSEWTDLGRVSLSLLQHENAGVVQGEGYLIVTVIGGGFPKEEIRLLSMPVAVPYRPESGE